MTLHVPTAIGRIEVHDTGPTDGATALLWPSLFSDGQTSWGAQLPGLHRLGWRTLLVDPPGTGQSPAVTRLFSMEECGEAAVAVLDAAGAHQAALLGLSWGGFVGLRVALAAPERVTALVLSNTSARQGTFRERLQGRLVANLVRVGVPGGRGRLVAGAMLSEESRRRDPAFAAEFARAANQLDKAGLVKVIRSVDTDRTSVVDALDRIAAPALVIAGAEDSVFPHEHGQELADRIPEARLEVLPGVAHLAPREAPTTVAGLLKDFLVPLNRKDYANHE